MKIKVIDNKIAIRPISRQEKTLGGIYLPENWSNDIMTGEVIGIPEKEWWEAKLKYKETSISLGELALYCRSKAQEITVNDESIHIIELENILALVEKEDK